MDIRKSFICTLGTRTVSILYSSSIFHSYVFTVVATCSWVVLYLAHLVQKSMWGIFIILLSSTSSVSSSASHLLSFHISIFFSKITGKNRSGLGRNVTLLVFNISFDLEIKDGYSNNAFWLVDFSKIFSETTCEMECWNHMTF